MKKLKNLSIGTKLLIFVVISVTIAITIIVSTTLLQFNSFNHTINEEQAIKGMEGLNSLIEDYKEQSLRHAKMISLNPDIINAIENKEDSSIYSIVNSIANYAKIDFITVTDSNGIVLARTHDAISRGDNVSGQASIQMALKGNAFANVESDDIIKLSARASAPVKMNQVLL